MPNKEYIEREALKRDLIDNRSFYPAIVKNAIESAPAVDVVEVVRCKDCEHWKKAIVTTTGGICGFRRSAKVDSDWFTRPNDFCSCGKRRKE